MKMNNVVCIELRGSQLVECKECGYKINKQTVARVVSFVENVEKAQKVGCFLFLVGNACSHFSFMLFQKKIIFCVVQGLSGHIFL